MRKLLVVTCILSFLAMALTVVNLLAPDRLAQAAGSLPLVSWVRLVDAKDASRVASVDAGGSLQVADQRLLFEQNDKAVAGSLKVSQQGPVAVGNFPPVQSVAGTVNVSNLPATQDVRVTNPSVPVSGSVNVSNLPSTQQVAGTVNVGNLPAVQDARIVNASVPVTGAVEVTNLGGFDLANVVHGEYRFCGELGSQPTHSILTVPSGHRLVLTYLFAGTTWYPDGRWVSVHVRAKNAATGETKTIVDVRLANPGVPMYDRQYTPGIVFEPGEVIEATVWADSTGRMEEPRCVPVVVWGVLAPVTP